MKLQLTIDHPAHVHFYKNLLWNLEKDEHEVKIVAGEKESTLDLLDFYGFNYEILGKHHSGLSRKFIDRFIFNYIFYKASKTFNPDILTSIGGTIVSHVGKIIRKPSIVFTDTEHAKLGNLLTFPFATTVCTPSCFKKDLGKKQVRYNGYHELAYLHPNYFKPDSSVLDKLNLTKNDKFIILRFVSWGASHDIGQKGLDINTKREYIKKLEDYGSVFITSEVKLTKDLERYAIRVSQEKIHDLLYYATMYIGEGATMATEAGILGTPSIYISSLVGTMGNFDELEKEYGLVYSFKDPQKALERVEGLLHENNLKSKWRVKREKLLKEKIDVTKWMTEFIGGYPESFYEYQNKNVPRN